jgi:predicted negative regulator of RcsB-dependent stress response
LARLERALQKIKEEKNMKEFGIIVLVIIVILGCVGLFGMVQYSQDPAFYDSVNATQTAQEAEQSMAQTQTQQPKEDYTIPLIFTGVIAFIIFVARLKDKFHKSIFIFVSIIILFAGVLGNWYYGDNNNDKIRDSPQINMIQPIGTPETDQINADTNFVNAQANTVNVAAPVVLIIALVLVLFIASFVAFILSGIT